MKPLYISFYLIFLFDMIRACITLRETIIIFDRLASEFVDDQEKMAKTYPSFYAQGNLILLSVNACRQKMLLIFRCIFHQYSRSILLFHGVGLFTQRWINIFRTVRHCDCHLAPPVQGIHFAIANICRH